MSDNNRLELIVTNRSNEEILNRLENQILKKEFENPKSRNWSDFNILKEVSQNQKVTFKRVKKVKIISQDSMPSQDCRIFTCLRIDHPEIEIKNESRQNLVPLPDDWNIQQERAQIHKIISIEKIILWVGRK